MRREQWEIFKKASRLEKLDQIPMAMIVDSPWIPGYLGIQHMDYYLDPELWFQSNLKIMEEYPDIIFVPSWWMEYGMAANPRCWGRRSSSGRTIRRASITRYTAWKISTSFPSMK